MKMKTQNKLARHQHSALTMNIRDQAMTGSFSSFFVYSLIKYQF